MPEASGVMLALVAFPVGPLNGNPPANASDSLYLPRLCGVWQSWQSAIRTRYSPRLTADESDGGTGAVIGWGKLRIRYFTGKIMAVCGSGLRTGASDRM